MAGAAVMIVILVVVLPVLIILTAPAFTAALGWLLQRDVDDRHSGSELLELSKKR